MLEQRNPYKGSPLRPWLELTVVASDGSAKAIQALADTGNPCPLIVDDQVLEDFNRGLAPKIETNFGTLHGGWLRLQIAEINFDEDVLCYASGAVAQAVNASHSDFEALAGLPLLRRTQYGGDSNHFWIRPLIFRPPT